MKRLVLLLTVLFFCACAAPADDDAHHHEDVTPEQLGTVHFPTSCIIQVQGQFERGVALLHSFWYEDAEKQFNQIVQEDPRCAMAHWGVAMSLWHELWNQPDRKTIKKGLAEVKKAEKMHSTDDRERGYISAIAAFYSGSKHRDSHDRALAYTKVMETNYQHHPEDREGAAFYALALLASAPEDTTFANQKKAGAILETLFAEEPNHPGIAHYIIHSYDSPQLAEMGLPAARAYAKIAPAAPHALHMPSHIFARLGLWQDDIDSNLASIAATRKTAAMHMGGESHQFHAMDFLEYAYLQSGREADAQRLIDEVKAMPEMKDNMYGSDFDPRIDSLVVFSARYDLELHHWSDAASLALVPGAGPSDNAITYWARAIGAARSGNPAEARNDIAEIVSIHKTLVRQKRHFFADYVDSDRKEAEAWLAYAEGNHDQALKTLRAIAEKQEADGDEPLAIPAREMLADMLLDMKQPEPALAEYEGDLKFNPNRFDGLYGAAHAAELAGKNSEANNYYAQLLKVCNGAASDRPELSKAKALLAKNN
jgi:tetratricopeptide (TPR) repeat protein